MILDEILEHKREEVAGRKEETPLEELAREAAHAPAARPFAEALRQPSQGQRRAEVAAGREPSIAPAIPRLIAEIKGRSPSRGTIRKTVDAAAIAEQYASAGAACISVLTDTRFFAGALERIPEVRDAVDLPVLQKDFIIDPYQVYEARCIGADCILLIVAALPETLLRELLALAGELGLDALVETHTAEEMETALEAGARLIGVNNRNLQTFEVSLNTTELLAKMVPGDRVLIGESGIFTRQDVERLAQASVDGVLVGEALMSAPDIPAKVRELFG
ncbi:MAG: indole-3-glycerol phosphate synthase [Armatimonadota bacterium]|nr:MAG: indole-3-glycerol phosphate synthase [Armatimonadota bacterium]